MVVRLLLREKRRRVRGGGEQHVRAGAGVSRMDVSGERDGGRSVLAERRLSTSAGQSMRGRRIAWRVALVWRAAAHASHAPARHSHSTVWHQKHRHHHSSRQHRRFTTGKSPARLFVLCFLFLFFFYTNGICVCVCVYVLIKYLRFYL
jgi:hypothetical protein